MARLAGFDVPRLGMGTMALAIEGRPGATTGGSESGLSGRELAIATIHAGLDAGVRCLDTAWSYYLPGRPPFGGTEDFGYGEQLVRDALRTWNGPREQVLVATKTGYLRSCDISGEATLPAVSDEQGVAASAESEAKQDAGPSPEQRPVYQAAGSRYGWVPDGRPQTIARQARESAHRLGVETLDLIYSHGPDPAVPYEEQMEAFRQLVDDGVVKHVGISRVNTAQIDIARNILGDRLVAVQNQFSPSHPDPEHTLEHCRELNLAFVCWSPLGGFLDPFDQHAYDPFRTVAKAHGCSYQRVVLAWEMAQYERLYTIPSARNPYEIRDSFAASAMTLSADELAMLGRSVDGDRFAPAD